MLSELMGYLHKIHPKPLITDALAPHPRGADGQGWPWQAKGTVINSSIGSAARKIPSQVINRVGCEVDEERNWEIAKLWNAEAEAASEQSLF